MGLPALFGDISEPPPSPIGAHCWWWHTPYDLLENIDTANQERDTRIYVHALWRLLTDTVLLLDFVAHARDLLAELDRLATSLGERVSLAGLVSAAESTRHLAAALATRPSALDATEAAEIDRALMEVSRALVPIDYTSGDRFAHDPALPIPAWASLQPLRALAGANPGSDAARFLVVDATRARNRVLHALRHANGVLQQAASG